MPASMTAFVRFESQTEQGQLSWEIRSVNHRYLDINWQLPGFMQGLEPKLRKTTQAKIARGRVECRLLYQPTADLQPSFHLDKALLARLVEVNDEVEHIAKGARPLSVADILRWQGVLTTSPVELEAIEGAVSNSLSSALDQLVERREQEGQALAQLLNERLDKMTVIVKAVSKHWPAIVKQQQESLQAKIKQLEAEIDESRLQQEIVYMAQKMDVAEEMDRLTTHIAAVKAVLKRKEPIGRRLDFLMQELNREANTLASKSTDANISEQAVDLKVLIEQMREQVQNIE